MPILTIRIKIRLLLLLITVLCAFTAVTIHNTFDETDTLVSEAKTLERNLQKKEKFVNDFLNDPVNFRALNTIDKDEEWGRTFIPEFGDERKIYLQTFLNHRVTFWNSIKVYFPSDRALKEGSSFIAYSNGWYEAIKRSSGNFSVVCYIPVKSRYPYTNEYLSNDFSEDLIEDSNLEIASFNDRNVYNIRTIDGKYLFSVKLRHSLEDTFTSRLELWMGMLSILSLLVLINYLAVWVVEKGYVKSAIFFDSSAFLIVEISQFNV